MRPLNWMLSWNARKYKDTFSWWVKETVKGKNQHILSIISRTDSISTSLGTPIKNKKPQGSSLLPKETGKEPN